MATDTTSATTSGSTRSLLTPTSSSTGSSPTGYTSGPDSIDPSAQPSASSTILKSLMANINDSSNSPGAIMDRYDQARSLLQQGQSDTEQSLNDQYGNYINDANIDTGVSTTNNMEGGQGFTQNLPALRLLTQAGDKRVRDLMNQRDELILQNKSDVAGRINDLIGKEQESITNARSAMISNLISAAGTSLNVADNETPQQTRSGTAITSLITSAPDAGILPTDDLATAAAKYRNSASYKNNISLGEANIQAALANASASSASAASNAATAANTRALTGFMGGSGTITNTDPDVQYLLNGGTVAGLQARYAGTPQAVKVPQIIQAAQSYGYDQNKASLNYSGQQTSTDAANSGSPISSLFANTRSLFQDPSQSGSTYSGPASTGFPTYNGVTLPH